MVTNATIVQPLVLQEVVITPARMPVLMNVVNHAITVPTLALRVIHPPTPVVAMIHHQPNVELLVIALNLAVMILVKDIPLHLEEVIHHIKMIVVTPVILNRHALMIVAELCGAFAHLEESAQPVIMVVMVLPH